MAFFLLFLFIFFSRVNFFYNMKERKEEKTDSNKELILKAQEIAVKGIKEIFKITVEALSRRET